MNNNITVMRQVICFIYLFFSVLSFAQKKNITLLFLDKETNEPIPNVEVTILKGTQDLVSNSEGKVTFSIIGNSKINVSQINFKPLTLYANSLKKEINEIYLTKNKTELDEIVITSKHPQSILKTVVGNSRKKFLTPVNLRMYTRELFKLNNNYTTYNDGIIDFVITNKNGDNFNALLLVEQNRTYNLKDTVGLDPSTLSYNLNDIICNYHSFRYLDELLYKSAKKKFDFSIKKYKGNEQLYEMVCTPNSDLAEFLPNINIIYDHTQNLIVEIDYYVEPERLKYSKMYNFSAVKGNVINQSTFKAYYHLDQNNYYLSHSKESIGIESTQKKNRKQQIEITHYFVTIRHAINNIPHKGKDIYKDKSLINKPNKIIDKYWENSSGFKLTKEEEAIVSSLQINNFPINNPKTEVKIEKEK